MEAKYTLALLALLWLAVVVGVLGAAGWTVQPEKSATGHTLLNQDGILTFSLATWLAKHSATENRQ